MTRTKKRTTLPMVSWLFRSGHRQEAHDYQSPNSSKKRQKKHPGETMSPTDG